jgi:hypothetical protein
MLKIKEYILKNKQIVGMALLGLVAAGGLVYFLTKKTQTLIKTHNNTKQTFHIKSQRYINNREQ